MIYQIFLLSMNFAYILFGPTDTRYLKFIRFKYIIHQLFMIFNTNITQHWKDTKNKKHQTASAI